MLSNSSLFFRGITRAVFARLRRRAAKNGIVVMMPCGEAVQNGVKIQWNYDEKTEALEVECVRAPFWIDRASINRKLSREIELALESDQAA
jgi:hypothetical protein